MKILRTALGIAPIACLLVALTAHAGSHPNRLYKGGPGLGPYGPAPRYKNPWNAKIFGIRCSKTPQEDYEKFLKQYQIAQAKHAARLNRLDWDAFDDYMNPPRSSLAGFVGRCNANTIPASAIQRPSSAYEQGVYRRDLLWMIGFRGKGHCGGCESGCADCMGACGSCGVAGCDGGCGAASCCGDGSCTSCRPKHRGLLGRIVHHEPLFDKHHRKRAQVGSYPTDPAGPPYKTLYPGYPGMNREDAVRYLEGMQYYPPRQIIRSPRDFRMWDTVYGLGR